MKIKNFCSSKDTILREWKGKPLTGKKRDMQYRFLTKDSFRMNKEVLYVSKGGKKEKLQKKKRGKELSTQITREYPNGQCAPGKCKFKPQLDTTF